MSDDLTGAPPPTEPPQPPAGPPTGPPTGPPVFLPPPSAPTPPLQGGGSEPADNWPWYFGLLALLIGLFASFSVSAILGGIYLAFGGDSDDAAFIVIATAAQAVVFLLTVVMLARSRGPVSARDFGLRKAPLWPTIGKAFAIMFSYLVILAIYNALVHLTPDDAPEKLGANAGVFGMLCFGILVAVIAPISEEIFFRGMVFRSFANGIGVWGGALASGLLFGALHIDSFSSDRLLQVVPLALLGVMFALLYAWSGTLYSTIALHATNNSLAVLVYANDHNSDFGMVLAVVIWVLMITGCCLGWKLTDNGKQTTAPPFDPPFDPPTPAVAPPPPQAGIPPQPAPPPDRPDFPWGQP